jgi:hypothetical protein
MLARLEKLVSEINRAPVRIPNAFAKVKDGTAYAYSQGLLAGRMQAVDMIKDFLKEEAKQPLL